MCGSTEELFYAKVHNNSIVRRKLSMFISPHIAQKGFIANILLNNAYLLNNIVYA